MVGNARIPDLLVLGRSFARVRARWARQGRQVRQLAVEADEMAKVRAPGHTARKQRRARDTDPIRDQVGYHAAWARWSATADELAELADQILRQAAQDLPDLVVKFDALAWLLLGDGAVLDHVAERQVQSFCRELRRLADNGSANRG